MFDQIEVLDLSAEPKNLVLENLLKVQGHEKKGFLFQKGSIIHVFLSEKDFPESLTNEKWIQYLDREFSLVTKPKVYRFYGVIHLCVCVHALNINWLCTVLNRKFA